MRGDVLFWTADGSPASRAIAFFTKGPFVHVSVDMGDCTDIGAHSEDGTQRRYIPSTCGITRWSPPAGENIERGMTFVEGEVGNKYGWGNIVNNVLKILRIPYRISRVDRYDCSNLVRRMWRGVIQYCGRSYCCGSYAYVVAGHRARCSAQGAHQSVTMGLVVGQASWKTSSSGNPGHWYSSWPL